MKVLFCLILLFCLRTSSGQQQSVFYVATNGYDTNGNGSITNPWATLGFAAMSIRPLLPTMTTDITVYIRSGIYYMNSTFFLSPMDSGQNSFNVIYTKYPGDINASILDGGILLNGFTPLSSYPSVYSTLLPVPLSRQVYIHAYSRMNESIANNVNFTSSNTAIVAYGYVTNDTALLQLIMNSPPEQQANDVEFLYTSAAAQWQESRNRVQSWVIINSTISMNNITCPCINITMMQPGFTLIRTKAYPERYPTGITNLLVTLQPGQGYISSSLGKIFYYPRPQIDNDIGENGSAIVAALDGPLIALQGENITNTANGVSEVVPKNTYVTINPVTNIILSNLVLQHTTWNLPTTIGGYAPDQGGIIYLPEDLPGPLPGHASHPVPSRGIQLSTVRNIVIDSCSLYRIGATGISIDNGSQNVTVTYNTLQDISCSGVRLGQVDDKVETNTERMNGNILIEDTYLYGLAMEYRDCSGIFGGYISNSTLSHNTLLNSSWAGVTFGWGGWGGCPVYPTLGGNRILSNYISYVNLYVGDGGPIYVMAPQPVPYSQCATNDLTCRSEMAYNYVSYAIHHAALLYHDEGTGYYYTHDNVVLQPSYTDPHGWWWSYLAAWASTEYNILMVNNTARGVSRADIYNGNNLVVENSTLLPWDSEWPSNAQTIINQAGVRKKLI